MGAQCHRDLLADGLACMETALQDLSVPKDMMCTLSGVSCKDPNIAAIITVSEALAWGASLASKSMETC
eukprot:533754-Amphidinium_carterae.1